MNGIPIFFFQNQQNIAFEELKSCMLVRLIHHYENFNKLMKEWQRQQRWKIEHPTMTLLSILWYKCDPLSEHQPLQATSAALNKNGPS